MRQSPFFANASTSSRLHPAVAYGTVVLFFIVVALVWHVASDNNGDRRNPFELQLAAIAGMLFGLALFGSLQMIIRRRQREPIIGSEAVHCVNFARYERAQAITQFGSYEICAASDSSRETNNWSQEMYRILGHDPAHGPLSTKDYIDQYVHPEDRESVKALVRKALHDAESAASEYRIVCSAGTVKHIYDYLEFVSVVRGQRIFHGQAFDITKCKLIESERLESAARHLAFVEQLGGLQYIGNLDDRASNVYISHKIENLLGFTADEWCSDPDLRFRQLYQDDRHTVLTAIGAHLSSHEPLSIDYRMHGKDGSLRWFHDESRIVTGAYGKPIFVQGVMFDITERKQAQQELERSHNELKNLIAALNGLREEEQKRLAREMHDDLGQLLAAMKMDLSDLQQYLPQTDTKVRQRLEGIHDLVNTMVVSVRRIIADLPPKILEDLGLINAIKLLGSNFQKRHHILCRLDLPAEEIFIEQKAATALYRMVQEALNNVAKHARATRVMIDINVHDEFMTLCITDNGIGMVASASQKAGSFGLIGIRERVLTLKGKVRIESTLGTGTAIHIMVPVAAQQLVEPS